MKNGKFYNFSKILICLVFLQSCILAQIVDSNSSDKSADGKNKQFHIFEENLIHFGDLIEIDVVGNFEYDWRGNLSAEGFLDGINFLEEPVYGLCRSETEIADKITEAYARFLRNPKVVVKILDRSNRPYSILSGAIKTPSRFQIKRPIQLNELLIISGGLTDRANGEIQIYRPQKLNCLAEVGKKISLPAPNSEIRERFVAAREDNGSQFINIKISDLLMGKEEANPQILSGDLINVMEAQPIYVIGGVEIPKEVSFRSQMSVTRAIASAGGLSKDADANKITIFRREGEQTKVIKTDLEKIKNEQSEDLILQAFDIVDVARRGKEEEKRPPIWENYDAISKNKLKLPLRIID